MVISDPESRGDRLRERESREQSSSLPGAHEKSPYVGSDRDRFLEIIGNHAKRSIAEHSPRVTGRHRGFVVQVTGTTNLQHQQDACFASDQKWNDCLTIRYRISGGVPFGTALVALAKDLCFEPAGASQTSGAFAPRLDDEQWHRRFESPEVQRGLTSLLGTTPESPGQLDQAWVEKLFGLLMDVHRFGTGSRLIIFAEVAEPTASAAEWTQAVDLIQALLPERFGFVVAGAPPNFRLADRDQHFLVIGDFGPNAMDKARPAGAGISRFAPSPLGGDQPAMTDTLGVRDLAAGLAQLMLHPETEPLTLGIQGPWGRGKSTFMGFLKSELVYWTGGDSKSRQELQDLNAQVAHHGPEHPAGRYEAERQRKRTWERMERRSHRDLVLVEVNAWRAEDSSQMWAMVAAAVARKMEQVLPWRSRVHARLRYAWRTHRSAILTQVLVPMAAAALCLGALAILIPGLTLSQDEIKELEAPIKLLVLAIPGLGATAFGWYLAAHSARVTKPVAEQMLSYLRMPEYQSEMGYQHRIIEDLRFMSECMQRAHPRRILVFIDDLDRCSEDKVVRMLQAIQLVLGASQFFVVIGFDARMVHRAIRLHYGNESALPEQFAEHFLRKIVHLSLTLPAAKPDERFKFVRHMFTPAARGDGEKEPDPEETGLGTRATFALPLGFDLEGLRPPVIAEYHAVRETAAELAIYERFQDCLGENPRDLKRLVNIHRLSKILLQRTSTDWPRERQEKLAAWLILCMACPNVVEPLLEMRAQRKPGTDCIEELLKGEAYASPQLQSFNLSRGTLRFIPSDLALGGDLHQAAMIMSAAVE